MAWSGRIALLSILLLGPGCRTVVWYGHDQGRRDLVEVEQGRGGQRVVVNGTGGPTFDGIGVEGLVLDASGRLVYPARRGPAWHLVDGGRLGPAWDGIGEVVLAPGHGALAYAAERGGRWRVVRDGVEERDFEALLEGTLTWDPGGRHLAYAAVEGTEVQVVADGVAGPPFDGVAGLAVAADGRAGYLARRGDAPFVVLGGLVRPAGEAVAHLALAPGGGGVAWAERRDGRWRVMVDGEDGPEADEVLAVAVADGRWGAILRQGGRCLVVVDGVEVGEEPSADDLRLAGRHAAWLAWRPDGQVVVVDGRDHRYDMLVEGTLALDVNGRWAVVAGDAGSRRVEILVDGVAVERFDFAEAALAGGDGIARARSWAAAVLASQAAGAP
jgi:hypothetical protein